MSASIGPIECLVGLTKDTPSADMRFGGGSGENQTRITRLKSSSSDVPQASVLSSFFGLVRQFQIEQIIETSIVLIRL